MPLGLQALIPGRMAPFDPRTVEAELLKRNRQFLLAVAKRMMYYPPQEPGGDYVRTGDYGRGWTAPGSMTVTTTEAVLINKIAYAVYVGGPLPGSGAGHRQAAVMTRKGWTSISVAAREEIKGYPYLIQAALIASPGA